MSPVEYFRLLAPVVTAETLRGKEVLVPTETARHIAERTEAIARECARIEAKMSEEGK